LIKKVILITEDSGCNHELILPYITGMLINFISKAIQKKLMRAKKYLLKAAGSITGIKIPITIACIKNKDYF
jgi:hypothetical protein